MTETGQHQRKWDSFHARCVYMVLWCKGLYLFVRWLRLLRSPPAGNLHGLCGGTMEVGIKHFQRRPKVSLTADAVMGWSQVQ